MESGAVTSPDRERGSALITVRLTAALRPCVSAGTGPVTGVCCPGWRPCYWCVLPSVPAVRLTTCGGIVCPRYRSYGYILIPALAGSDLAGVWRQQPPLLSSAVPPRPSTADHRGPVGGNGLTKVDPHIPPRLTAALTRWTTQRTTNLSPGAHDDLVLLYVEQYLREPGHVLWREHVQRRPQLCNRNRYIFIYTYNDILNNAEAINVEVMMRMLKILWKETERKRVVEN